MTYEIYKVTDIHDNILHCIKRVISQGQPKEKEYTYQIRFFVVTLKCFTTCFACIMVIVYIMHINNFNYKFILNNDL